MKKFTLWMTMALMSLTAGAQEPTAVLKASRTAHSVQLKAPAKAAELRDDNGIIVAPASGETTTFNRTGKLIYPVGFDISEGDQSGTTDFVFCEDGTVYLRHPLTQTLERCGFSLKDTWIKGRLEGDKIIFAGGQPISYSNGYRSRITLCTGDVQTNAYGSYEAVANPDEDIVFQITREGKIISLLNSNNRHVLCMTREGHTDAYDYWDYETVFVRDTTGEHAEAVTPPAGLATTKVISAGYDATEIYDPEVQASYTIGNVSFSSELGFQGNDAYLSNFSYYGQGHWLKGERQADGKLVFPKEQFITTLTEGNYDLYVYALPHGSKNAADACDLVLTYDAATKNYVSQQDLFISYEKMGSVLDRAECLENFKLVSYNDVAPAPIFSAPKGYRQISYERYGKCLSNMVGWFNAEDVPDYQINIAYNPNGNDVYMESPIGAAQMDAWVKGTIEEDGKLHVPTMQWIQHDADYGDIRTGVFGLKWLNKSRVQYTYEWMPEVKEVTFSIDEDGFLTLDPLGPDQVEGEMPPLYTYGFVRGTEEYSWCGLSDAYTIYTPIEGSEIIIDSEDVDPIIPDTPDEPVDISKMCPGEEHNDYGIITAPGNGTEYTYNRSGGNYTYVANNIEEGTQSGVAHLVETADGYVFLQHPLSSYGKAYAATAWIKGVKKDNTYVFPEGQPINHDDYWESDLVVCMGELNPTDQSFDPKHNRNIVFAISDDGKTLTLQNSSDTKPMALFYSDDDAWVGYGDYSTTLTYVSGGHVEETVQPSWKAERLNYTITANDVEVGPVGYNAVIAFDEGDVVYLGNFSFWLDYQYDNTGKYVWIKGKRRSDGSLLFPREQYLYTYNEGGKDYDLFFYGLTEPFEGAYSPADLVLTYNEAADIYVAEQDILLTWGRITTSIPRAEQLSGAILTRDEFEGSRPYIITEQPKGELRSYARSGFAFGFDNSDGMIYSEPQDGMDINLVFSEDGKYVYMQNPVSKTLLDSWVSGTIDEEGNLHFPLFQWLDYNEDFNYGVRTAACVLVEQGNAISYYMVPNLIEMSFTLNKTTGAYTLDRIDGIDYSTEAPRLIYGCYWTNDNSWTGFGDFDSVYTPNFPWSPDDEGIASIVADKKNDTYYDFQGRIARPNSKGLYINAGRKMIVK